MWRLLGTLLLLGCSSSRAPDLGAAPDAGVADAGHPDAGRNGGPLGPIYETVPPCDDPTLWALETTVPVTVRDWYGVEAACDARTELP